MTTVAGCGFSILQEIFKMIYLSIRPLKDQGRGAFKAEEGREGRGKKGI